MQWLKKAFAIDPPGEAIPDELQQPIVDAFCQSIVSRELTTPVLMLLEMVRPLNYVGAQLLHALAPFFRVMTDKQAHQYFAQYLERRGSIDYLCNRIENFQQQAAHLQSDPPDEIQER